MKKKQLDSKWQILLSIICLFYGIGIVASILFVDKIPLQSLLVYKPFAYSPFFNSLVYFFKFLLPIWVVGISSIGIFLIIPWCIICGCFYGITVAPVIANENAYLLFLNLIQFFLFTFVLFMFSAGAINFSLNKYKNYRNPKTSLIREKKRIGTEYLIMLCLGFLITLIISFINAKI